MPQIINTNIASLNAQRNLNRTQGQLETSLQRLSTGLRINSARDDAAGLAISERFTTQIRGLNQAVRNANDGISFAQTAEGALSTVGDSLQRIRELAVQSINDTNSSSDRSALNNEVGQLIAEVNRIANTTQFNGQNVLDGSLSNLTFQVGANQNQTISVNGVDSRGSTLGADTETGTLVTTADITGSAGALTLNGTTIDTAAAVASGDIDDLVTAINAVANDSGVQAQKASTLEAHFVYDAVSVAAGTADAVVTLNGVDVTIADGATITAAVTAINDVSGQTGVTATESGAEIILTSQNAADINLTQDATDTFDISVANATQSFEPAASTSYTIQAGVLLSTDVGSGAVDGSIIVGGADAADFGLADADNTNARLILNDVDVLTSTTANDALLTLDFALQKVTGLRAELGAVQTRFESTISNLTVTSENLSAARSRIRDADFAAETAELTRAQILQQAGISVLAQANVLPQSALALLQ